MPNTRMWEFMDAAEARKDVPAIKAVLIASTLVDLKMTLMAHNVPKEARDELMRTQVRTYQVLAPEAGPNLVTCLEFMNADIGDICANRNGQ